MWAKTTLMVVFLAWSSLGQEQKTKQHPELPNLVRSWAQKLGGELLNFGELVTRKTRVNESFKRHTSIKDENGEKMLKDIHEKIYNMTREKVEAVKRIMDIAEEAARSQKEEHIKLDFQFVNAKTLNDSAVGDQEGPEVRAQEVRYDDSFISTDSRFEEKYQAMVQADEDLDGYQRDQDPQEEEESKASDETDGEIEVTDGSEKDPQASQVPQIDRNNIPLYRNSHFYNIPVNTNFSAVHVPSNVYERSTEVISGIIWSEVLDTTFKDNYQRDPSLSWQYFGSSTGFMRQFPAMKWNQDPIDLFDCRTRSWFIEAASSPKDVVILVDRSGSMTGMRREIARHVVHNILDTLGNNDYVNILTFSNTTDPLIDCFDSILVQANLANVRLLKEGMSTFRTEQIANLSLALVTAFRLLEAYRNDTNIGANCNQAIMLVTDGVQDNYMKIFKDYNWNNLPFVNVRVFTYLIGREVSDVREVKWMACANRGYYVHLSTYAEVREEVLQYIPVMARPMVLNAGQKPNPTWSPVYADVTDPKLTNWLWINRERNKQRERLLAYFGRKKTLLSPDEQDKKFVHQQKHKQDNYGELQTYRLMTSVSLPVYDKKPRAERVANLLGVAGTDIPIEYIEALMLPYRLGVNGFAFIVTNNGYILTHPDLRPVHQGILKPAYNRVDMIEVEVLDDGSEPRHFADEILEFRRRVVMQETGDITLEVKRHLDDMRRLVTGTRHYYYMGVNNTPFTIVISLPGKYGFYKVEHSVENDIHRMRSDDKIDKSEGGWLTQFFTGNWTLHPDWHYCRYMDDRHYFETPEEELLHFLKKIEGIKWKWLECDRRLITKVVADAKITSWFSENITTANYTKEENGEKFIRRFGITVAFLATHSGLTRWQDFPQNIDANAKEEPTYRHFHILHNKAIDEIWYKRAVEYHYKDHTAYVYSVPFDVGDENNTLLTVSHAIFREEGAKKSPAAVIGYQSYHSALYSLFRNITTSCGDIACTRTCETDELDCFLLDENGYIIVSDDLTQTGYFFGKFRPDIMGFLVNEGIYNVTRMYDYQGLCPEEEEASNPAPPMSTPLHHLSDLVRWASATLFYLLRTVSGSDPDSMAYPDEEHEMHNLDEQDSEAEATEQPSRFSEKEFDQRVIIKKTKPECCDFEMWYYRLVHYSDRNISNSGYNKVMTDDCTRPFIVQKVFSSNMILLVLNSVCWEKGPTVAKMPDPVQVDYNMSFACYRELYNNYTRRHYMSCINRNANESEIKLCGLAPHSRPWSALLVALLSTALYAI
ncbi:voltage-dependent calcium channel subunit alpha-2/delta-3-like isoform X2 [Zophobas morio]|uniref:voltage-dependent calcium channel subunit alpha-2/delta-3-like isoform X2 n=1 Tax=Zophobas morio TaxID=2755281 RepID=UPI0030836221